jgi:hypothetical protein
MINIDELHEQAMDYAYKADKLKRKNMANNKAEILLLYSKGYELEKEVAMSFVAKIDYEPMRAVYFRSAACMAFDAQRYQEAARMAACGLAGNPDENMVMEFCEILYKTIRNIKKQEKYRMQSQKQQLLSL